MGRQLRLALEPFLFIGDNLPILRTYIEDGSVDLIYLDPPFNSNKTYNIFRRVDGTPAAAQIKAFQDTWHWSEESILVFRRTVEQGGPVARVLLGFQDILGGCDMLAYLTMMAPRLIELHRVLKPTGSLYLHCDPSASHYLKIVLDAVFGPTNFLNEIIWQRVAAKGGHMNRLPANHDVILSYSKSPDAATWHEIRLPYDLAALGAKTRSKYAYTDTDGRRYRLGPLLHPEQGMRPNLDYELMGVRRTWRWSQDRMGEALKAGRILQSAPGRVPQQKMYLDEQPGRLVGDVWTDISILNSQAAERLGYPTQKPLALLERIIAASSNPGDVVLDPFCGCGTTVDAAQRLGRRWIGIDVAAVALSIIEGRLAKTFPTLDYFVRFMPTTADELNVLVQRDKFAFQQWVCDQLGIDADIRKGADRGIDGEKVRYTINGKPWRAIVSVKGGGVNVTQIRDLRGTMEREHADAAIFVAHKRATRPMQLEALAAGLTEEGIPRIQIIEAADLVAHPERAVRFPVGPSVFDRVEMANEANEAQSSPARSLAG